MKVVLAMVCSANGKITRGNESDIYHWTSKEDSNHFFSLIKKYSVIIMGAGTYEAGKSHIHLQPHKLRVVLTRNTKQYVGDSVPDQLEFTNETPRSLLNRLSQAGHKEALLVGGSEINGLFLSKHVVDELLLTLEPKMFGTGKNLVNDVVTDVSLRLVSVKQLNRDGTLLLHYLLNT